MLDAIFEYAMLNKTRKEGVVAKGNRNQKCESCGKRHNAEKPCKIVTVEETTEANQ